jgi:plastocyanin
MIAALGLICTFAVPAANADVTGQVALGKAWARDAVVSIEGDKTATPLGKVVVDQRNKAFSPHVSVVTVGTTIEFPNNDTVFHNVFAYFDARKFDLGMYPQGAKKSVTFPKTGFVSLQCNVHSEMSAYIVVVDTPYYAKTDGQGHFTVKNVPDGQYTVKVWHESGAYLSQPLTVKGNDAPLKLEISRKK